MKKKIKTF